MICNMYAIFDTKADMYNQPFMFTTNGQAIRAFSDLACDTNSFISKHPDDYRLYRIGTFDDATGLLEPCRPEPLGMATEYIPKRVEG